MTALSRSHNFYFVACNDEIHVHQPTFPDQLIPSEPELILHPPTTSPFLQPGIDYQDSHSVTRLHVDYLGQDEIILITCDDGDVIGYRTEEVQRVLDKRAEDPDDGQDFHVEVQVKTFLHRNVGASAWGLAIHREARMIAISANTHKVTVIAYALAQDAKSSDESSSSFNSDLDFCPEEEDTADFPSPRRQDHVITLCARHNVPAVSFNNSGDDPSGRWLSSSSINGEALVWDLHQSWEPARVLRLGFCASVKDPTKAPTLSPGDCACLRPGNFPHAVWSTLFLCTDTAYERTSAEDTALENQHLAPFFQDVSKCKERFKVSSRQSSKSAMETSLDTAMSDEDSSEMEVSESGSDDSDNSGSLYSPLSDVVGIEQANANGMGDSVGSGDVDANELAHEAISIHANNGGVSTDTPHGVDNSTSDIVPPLIPPPPPASIPDVSIPGNAINAFGVWFQPPGQNTATIVWDDSDSEFDDSGFVSSTTHWAFTGLSQPMRGYCEVQTTPSFQNQVREHS